MTTTRTEAVRKAADTLRAALEKQHTEPEEVAFIILWDAARMARKLLKPWLAPAEPVVSTETLDEWLARTEPDL